MKILSKSNEARVINFKAHIIDNGGCVDAIAHSHLSKEQNIILTNALKVLQRTYDNDYIILDKYDKRIGHDNCSIYVANLKSTGTKLAEVADCGWCKFVVHLANQILGVHN